MRKIDSFWAVPVVVDEIPDAGRHLEIEAPPDVLTGLAVLAGVREVSRLSAVFDLQRHGAGVQVAGHVRAHVGQNCVVTLEPLETDIEEAVDLVFAPAADGEAAKPGGPRQRPTGDDEPPEPLVDGVIDLGAVATEFMILGIDPFPRKPGAAFGALKIGDDAAHPFAALQALKKDSGGKDGR